MKSEAVVFEAVAESEAVVSEDVMDFVHLEAGVVFEAAVESDAVVKSRAVVDSEAAVQFQAVVKSRDGVSEAGVSEAVVQFQAVAKSQAVTDSGAVPRQWWGDISSGGECEALAPRCREWRH